VTEPGLYPARTRAPFGGARKKKAARTLVVAATTSPPPTKARSSTRTTTALTTPTSVVGDLCFDARFSQLEPKPPSGGRQKKKKKLFLNKKNENGPRWEETSPLQEQQLGEPGMTPPPIVMGIGLFKSLLVVVHTPRQPQQLYLW
jgi:hypothetical protein